MLYLKKKIQSKYCSNQTCIQLTGQHTRLVCGETHPRVSMLVELLKCAEEWQTQAISTMEELCYVILQLVIVLLLVTGKK